MTEKNDFSFFSNCYQRLTLGKCRTRAERHVTGGISCRTAYIHDPRVKGHPNKILYKIKKNKQKKLFFSKKNSCRTACYAVPIAPNRHKLNVPRPLHQPWKKKFEKKLKNDQKKWFFFFLQRKCRTACYRWNNVSNRIYSWSPSQGASEKNILKN